MKAHGRQEIDLFLEQTILIETLRTDSADSDAAQSCIDSSFAEYFKAN